MMRLSCGRKYLTAEYRIQKSRCNPGWVDASACYRKRCKAEQEEHNGKQTQFS